MDRETRVTLSNGKTVVNFSSRRELRFEDGSILKGCSERRATYLLCKPNETQIPMDGCVSVMLEYHVTDHLMRELRRLEDDETVDVILVPMPLMSALTGIPGFERLHPKVHRIQGDRGLLPIDKFYK